MAQGRGQQARAKEGRELGGAALPQGAWGSGVGVDVDVKRQHDAQAARDRRDLVNKVRVKGGCNEGVPVPRHCFAPAADVVDNKVAAFNSVVLAVGQYKDHGAEVPS